MVGLPIAIGCAFGLDGDFAISANYPISVLPKSRIRWGRNRLCVTSVNFPCAHLARAISLPLRRRFLRVGISPFSATTSPSSSSAPIAPIPTISHHTPARILRLFPLSYYAFGGLRNLSFRKRGRVSARPIWFYLCRLPRAPFLPGFLTSGLVSPLSIAWLPWSY